MRREEVLRVLREQPFRPFRIRLSNGTTFDIQHPDLAIPTLSAVYIGVPSPGGFAADDIIVVSLVHVVSLEYLAAPTTPATGTNGSGG